MCRDSSVTPTRGSYASTSTTSIPPSRSRNTASRTTNATITSWPALRSAVPRRSRVSGSDCTTRILPTIQAYPARGATGNRRSRFVDVDVGRRIALALRPLVPLGPANFLGERHRILDPSRNDHCAAHRRIGQQELGCRTTITEIPHLVDRGLAIALGF